MRFQAPLLHHCVTEHRRAERDHLVSAFLFKHKPWQCPFGHSLAPGRPQTVGWKPCICAWPVAAAAPPLASDTLGG